MRSDQDVLPIRHHISKYLHGGLMARYDRPSHHSRCPQSRPTAYFLQGSWSFVEVILGVGRDWKQCEYQCAVTRMCFQSAITSASIYTAARTLLSIPMQDPPKMPLADVQFECSLFLAFAFLKYILNFTFSV